MEIIFLHTSGYNWIAFFFSLSCLDRVYDRLNFQILVSTWWGKLFCVSQTKLRFNGFFSSFWSGFRYRLAGSSRCVSLEIILSLLFLIGLQFGGTLFRVRIGFRVELKYNFQVQLGLHFNRKYYIFQRLGYDWIKFSFLSFLDRVKAKFQLQF